jgi:hypothetical protein
VGRAISVSLDLNHHCARRHQAGIMAIVAAPWKWIQYRALENR